MWTSQLETSDQIAKTQTASAPETSEAEKQAIRQYCTLCIRKKQLSEESSKQKKQFKQDISLNKKLIQDHMQKNNLEIMVLSKDDYKRLETETTALDLPMVPMYVRLIRNTKDDPITVDLLNEAFDTVTQEDIQEQMTKNNLGFADAFQATFLATLRNLIRSYRMSLRFSNTKDRTVNLYDIPECTPEIVKALLKVHIATENTKAASDNNKEAISEITKEIQANKSAVQSFFERTQVMSQRIVMDGSPYRLTRKITVRHEKLGITKIESLLQNVTNGIQSMEDFTKVRTQLLKTIQNIPPITKSDICFSAVKTAK